MSPMFLTENGLSVPAVTADQMVEVDRIALEETGPTRFQMMEKTGRHLAQQAMDCLRSQDIPKVLSDTPPNRPGPSRALRVVVLAGGGMNGGGGICAAKHLANQGLDVYLCLANAAALTDISRWQYHLYQESPGQQVAVEELTSDRWPLEHGEADLIVDALMACRVPQAPVGNDLALIHWANGQQTPILSLDIPSGMDATQGNTPGAFMQARWTMTLALPKTGLHPEMTGELILADIGIPAKTYRAKSLKLSYRSPFQGSYRVPLHYQTSVASEVG